MAPAGPSTDNCTCRAQIARSARPALPLPVLYYSRPEQTHTATHAATGLLVKVRPNLFIGSPARRRRTLVDFKTTSCPTEQQFRDTIEKYGYDRQQALYADVLGATRVLLIAVQKRPRKGQEPAVWVVELTAEQLANGRRKYARLLRAHAEQVTANQLPALRLPTSPAPTRLVAVA